MNYFLEKEVMNANSNIKTDFIRDSTEDIQSSVEEFKSTRDIGEQQQRENETNFGNSDPEYVLSDTDLVSDVESEEERPNLAHAAKVVKNDHEYSTETNREQEETYMPKELKEGIFKFLITLRD